ncbi:MAG: LysR substrate-binding domain-containing protein [Pseudomonadota bacterium]
MDTQNIALFVRAAETLNISAAGRSLGFGAAVASARLAKLEEGLGVTLLYRSTRKVSLSLEGEEFLPFAREILAQEAAARAALGQERPSLKGTLRFAAPSSFAQAFIIPLLPRFQSRHPDLTLDLKLSDAPVNPIEASFDLALRNMMLADSALKARKLADDQRILAASPGYLAAAGGVSGPDDLGGHRLIAFGRQDAAPLRGPGGAKGLFDPKTARGRLIVDDGQSQRIAALTGQGICLTSLWAVAKDIAEGRLFRVLPDWELDQEMALWLVYPSTHVVSPKVRAFIDFLLSELGGTKDWAARV